MENAKLSPKVIADLVKCRRSGMSLNQIASKFKVSKAVVHKYTTSADCPHDPVEAEREKSDRDREKREFLQAVKEQSFRKYLADLIRQEVTPIGPIKPIQVSRSKSAHLRFPLLHLSDWHFEEIVNPEAVMGLNEYSIPTACRRVHRVIRAFLAWSNDVQASGRIRMPELVVALNGDFLTGTLHGLERHTDAPNVVRATLACSKLIAMALRDLCGHFPKVKVVGTVGNHGRLPDDKKVPTKDPTRSWDFMAYSIAAELLRGQPNISFVLPDAYGAVYEVGGHTVYQGHGNFVKQQLGIVGYGMRRFVSNLAANMSAAGKSLKYAVFGHFHSANSAEFAGVTTFIGPSLIGTQEYGFLSGGSVNRPAQQCYVFDKELGHVTTETLYGDGPEYAGTYEVKV